MARAAGMREIAATNAMVAARILFGLVSSHHFFLRFSFHAGVPLIAPENWALSDVWEIAEHRKMGGNQRSTKSSLDLIILFKPYVFKV